MSKRGRVPADMWENYRAMSVDVGRLVPFMKETAMMGLEERKLVAYSMSAKDMFEDPEFSQFVDTFVLPFLTKLGRAKWPRDVVTDLGFGLANRQERKKKLGEGLLKYEPGES